jgi:hypothetical protein
MDESEKLQGEAVALWKRYGFMLPSTVRGFLLRLAAFLDWWELEEAMK